MGLRSVEGDEKKNGTLFPFSPLWEGTSFYRTAPSLLMFIVLSRGPFNYYYGPYVSLLAVVTVSGLVLCTVPEYKWF